MVSLPIKKCRNLLCILTIILMTVVGCNANPKKFGMPNLQHPGTAAAQRSRAVRFDPYPEPNMAPETEGLRPREYSQPLAEPLRSRWPILE